MHGKTLLALALCLSTSIAFGDVPSRPATQQEKAALQKALAVITKVIDSFGNADWKKSGEFSNHDLSVSKEPAAPIDSSLNFNRKYEIAENSPLFKSKLMPVYQKADVLAKQGKFDELQKLTRPLDGTMQFVTEQEINRINAGGSKITKIAAKGATLAYETASDAGEYEVVVGVGDWAHATPGAMHLVDYHFAHPRGTPFIENIVFSFHTRKSTGFAAERIREIVRTTDWGELNQGLTR